MENTKDIFSLLSEESRGKLKHHGISNNEMLSKWVKHVPIEVLINEFLIPEELAEELINISLSCEDSNDTKSLPGGYNFTTKLSFGNESAIEEAEQVNLADYPDNIDLSWKVPKIKDQGNYGSCVAFAFTSMLESVLDFKRELSPRFCYLTTKWIEGNERQGTRLEYAVESLKRFGICEENIWPYTTRNILSPPPFSVLEEAKKIQLVKYHEHHQHSALKFILDALSGLMTGKPQTVAIGLRIFQSSWNYEIIRKYGKIILPFSNETTKSGHAMVIAGFIIDPNYAGGGYFIVLNSHGLNSALESTLCEPGFLVIPFEYIERYCKEAVAVIELDENPVAVDIPWPVLSPVAKTDVQPQIFARKQADTTIKHQVRLGTTGSGKTKHTKDHLLLETHSHKIILDVQGDYVSDQNFIEATDAAVWDIMEDGFPHNILFPAHDHTVSNQIAHKLHVEWLLSCFKACIHTLGSRQRSLLKEQLDKLVFAASEFENIQTQITDMIPELKNLADGSGSRARVAESLCDQLQLIFDLGILDKRSDTDLSEIIRANKTIIFKCVLPDQSRHILNIVTMFLVNGIFSLYKMTAMGVSAPAILVLDEFHRLPKVKLWENIVREGRKFNFALWAISQLVDDMDELLPNIGERFVFKVANGEQARKISKKFGWSKKHQAHIEKLISKLQPYEYIDPVKV